MNQGAMNGMAMGDENGNDAAQAATRALGLPDVSPHPEIYSPQGSEHTPFDSGCSGPIQENYREFSPQRPLRYWQNVLQLKRSDCGGARAAPLTELLPAQAGENEFARFGSSPKKRAVSAEGGTCGAKGGRGSSAATGTWTPA